MLVSGSFLSKDIKPKEAISILDKANIDYLHVDIMDGKFVSEKTFTMGEIEKFSSYTSKPMDVHLMVKNPEKWVDSLSMLNVGFITFHYEAVKDSKNLIEHIKNNGIKVGVSINPDTNVKEILPLLSFVDMVLVMSVNPGKSGQKFMESVLYKLEVLRHEMELKGYKTIISIDGGINNETFLLVKDKVDMVVSASYLLEGDAYKKVMEFKNS